MNADDPIRELGLALANLSTEELAELYAVALMPQWGAAPDFMGWIRRLAQAEIDRREGLNPQFPQVDFRSWSTDESAHALLAAVGINDGFLAGRLSDITRSLVKITACNAAAALVARNIAGSN